MVTLTTLAESNCRELWSQHPSPLRGSSTWSATLETRPVSAVWMSRASLAASPECDEDRQKLAATVVLTVALAAGAASKEAVNANIAAPTTNVNPSLGFIPRSPDVVSVLF
jgi:hypothetical protein